MVQMIIRITIHNFQPYRHIVLDLSPGINAIVGYSQAGKTAIIRALEWVIKNRPMGFRFHHKYTKEDVTYVEVLFDNNISITRYKSKKENLYIVKTQKETTKYRAGTTIPDVVAKLINMSDINIQEQLDPHFLISNSGPEISRAINSITNAEDADGWIKQLTRRSAAIKMQLKMVREEYASTARQVQKYKGIERAGKLIIKFHRAEKRRLKLEEEYSNIENILAEIEDTEIEIKRYKAYLKAGNVLDKMELVIRKIERLLEEKDLLFDILQEKKKIEKSKHLLLKTQKEYVRVLQEAGLCPFCFGKVKNIRSIEHGIKELYTT